LFYLTNSISSDYDVYGICSQFLVLGQAPRHPSLHFKKVGKFWSARVGRNFRAIAVPDEDDYIWVWIGSHDEYEELLNK